MDLEVEVYDETTVRGEELEKQTYLEEHREFQEGDVEALTADGGEGGGVTEQPEAMEGDYCGDVDTDSEDDEAMTPTDPPVKVDMEVGAKILVHVV